MKLNKINKHEGCLNTFYQEICIIYDKNSDPRWGEIYLARLRTALIRDPKSLRLQLKSYHYKSFHQIMKLQLHLQGPFCTRYYFTFSLHKAQIFLYKEYISYSIMEYCQKGKQNLLVIFFQLNGQIAYIITNSIPPILSNKL